MALPYLLVSKRLTRYIQEVEQLSWMDHLSWATLIQTQQLPKHHYPSAARLNAKGKRKDEICASTILGCYILNARIYQQTGSQFATVNVLESVVPLIGVSASSVRHALWPVIKFG